MFCFILFWIASSFLLAMTMIHFRHCEERSNPEEVCNAISNYNHYELRDKKLFVNICVFVAKN